MKDIFALTQARAVVADDNLCVRVRTTPGGSYYVMSVGDWYRRLCGEVDPPVCFVRAHRPTPRRRNLRRGASVLT